jgi:regulation of enolase protein 1 (concanavalin A-like superfamily)
MIYFDEKHWLRAGIEIIDDIPRLSCVVTNDNSDFSLQTWKDTSLRIRITQKGNGSYVVEAHLMGDEEESKEESGYSFIRIAQL